MERTRALIPKDVISMKKLYTTYILKLLSKDSKIYGKEITDQAKDHFKNTYFKVSHTTIYTTLHSLEEEGFVTSTWDSSTSLQNRGKRYYRITDEGLRYFKLLEKETLHKLNENRDILDKLIQLIS